MCVLEVEGNAEKQQSVDLKVNPSTCFSLVTFVSKASAALTNSLTDSMRAGQDEASSLRPSEAPVSAGERYD